jgi:hypothetical protein
VLFIALLSAVALVLLLREPIAELRRRRRTRAQERKREWRRQREADREQRRLDRAMNPAKVAAKRGPPRWQQVAQRQGGKCWLCGTRTYADDRRRGEAGSDQLGATFPTVDYVVPIDAGGTYDISNARIAHRVCAGRRRDHPGHETFRPPSRTYPR